MSKYLIGFDNLKVITKFNEKDATYETRPAKRPMTIRHLLTHTSGIAYGAYNPTVDRLNEVTKKHEWELPLSNDPGDKWNYGPAPWYLARSSRKSAASRSKHITNSTSSNRWAWWIRPMPCRPLNSRAANGIQPYKRRLKSGRGRPYRPRRRPRSEATAASTRPPRITASSFRC